MPLTDHAQIFIRWLDQQLTARDWTDAELSRRAGLAHSVISKARSSGQVPSWDACFKLAIALSLPPMMVFVVAGLLPAQPAIDPDQLELRHLIALATPAQRREMLRYIRYIIEQSS